jgi:hypothetical protein|tara:strand:+ start:131 stop:268 length:138 start_codon:yes stop_codon:yes gene_type:complete
MGEKIAREVPKHHLHLYSRFNLHPLQIIMEERLVVKIDENIPTEV